MNRSKRSIAALAAPLLATLLILPVGASADIDAGRAHQDASGGLATGVLASYEQLLPLEGGSNFRDMGGYPTADGKTVRKGLLYRSGVMTGLTEKDAQYLADIGFDTVVDLRSSDELELYPNHWARKAGVAYLSHNYSMADMFSVAGSVKAGFDMGEFYRVMPATLKPQLRMYFDSAINGEAPLVVNCSAGQDRTGIASALMLSALGVPRQHVVQDYVLSTHYRRPDIERGSIDLAAAAETNDFARMLLRYSANEPHRAQPLITGEGIPYINFTFAQIEADHGSVLAYLEEELDVSAADIQTLRQHYLQ